MRTYIYIYVFTKNSPLQVTDYRVCLILLMFKLCTVSHHICKIIFPDSKNLKINLYWVKLANFLLSDKFSNRIYPTGPVPVQEVELTNHDLDVSLGGGLEQFLQAHQTWSRMRSIHSAANFKKLEKTKQQAVFNNNVLYICSSMRDN